MEETLGAFIRRKRIERGWNQTQFADASGIDRPYLSQIESGKVALPGAGVRRQLASALGLRHIDILIASGEITADEVEGLPDPDSPAIAALRPVLDSYDGDVDQLVRVIQGIIRL